MFQKILYTLARALVRLYASLMLRFDVHQHGPLPQGPKIFVANHPSSTDPFLIHLLSKEGISVLITEKAFRVPIFGSFLRSVGEISVPLEHGNTALEHAYECLKRGRSVAIFIEGRTSPPEGGFLPPRTGAARLALRSRVPVVPVGISLRRLGGVMLRSAISGIPSEGYWYFVGPYKVTVGQPLQFEGDVEDREGVHRISELIMERIRSLAQESERRIYPAGLTAPLDA